MRLEGRWSEYAGLSCPTRVDDNFFCVPQPVAWTITIRPIVDYLRGNDVHGSRLALLLPWVWLWRRIVHGGGNSYGRVACAADSKMPTPNRFATTHFHDSPLVAVMEFLPLREAFGEYCRRALCSEVN